MESGNKRRSGYDRLHEKKKLPISAKANRTAMHSVLKRPRPCLARDGLLHHYCPTLTYPYLTRMFTHQTVLLFCGLGGKGAESLHRLVFERSDVSEVCTVLNFRVFEFLQWLPTKVLTTPSAGFWPQQPSTLFPRVPLVRHKEKNRYWKY
jgi:hypothetical protein